MLREGLCLNSPTEGLAQGPGLGQGQGQGLMQGLEQEQARSEVGVAPVPPFPPQTLDSFVASVRSRTWRMDVQTLHNRCILLTLSPQVGLEQDDTSSRNINVTHLIVHPLNTSSQHILSTHPLETSSQHTHSTHLHNTPSQHPLSTPLCLSALLSSPGNIIIPMAGHH